MPAQHAFQQGLGLQNVGKFAFLGGIQLRLGEINFCNLIKHFILLSSVISVCAGTPLHRPTQDKISPELKVFTLYKVSNLFVKSK